MQNVKFGVLASGLVGLIACFLPMVSEGGMSITFWDTHELAMGQTLMVMLGYGVGLVMGVLAMKTGMAKWQAIVALIGFAFVVFKFRGGFLDMLTHGAIGGKLMFLAAVAGLVFAIVALVKPTATAK